jgi:hypothetical protein
LIILSGLGYHAPSVIADLAGPGIIRHIHTTRHHPAELFGRGIVLEIWFDDAATLAVMSPLADFFGDGGNGRAADFGANLIECAPWSYNCYFTMPFRTRARVVLEPRPDRRTAATEVGDRILRNAESSLSTALRYSAGQTFH